MIKIHQKKCQYLSETRSGRPEAQEGCHDDLVMALAIAYYIRPQQSFKLIENKDINEIAEKLKSEFKFNTNKTKKGDYGSKISIIQEVIMKKKVLREKLKAEAESTVKKTDKKSTTKKKKGEQFNEFYRSSLLDIYCSNIKFFYVYSRK